jgi:hypothetical protein
MPRCCSGFYGVRLRPASSARCPMTLPIGLDSRDRRQPLCALRALMFGSVPGTFISRL